MRILEVIRKTAKEQIRNFWVFALTVIMAPFFAGVYYLISESTKPVYDVLILNQDKGIVIDGLKINHGKEFVKLCVNDSTLNKDFPLYLKEISNKDSADILLKEKKADALIIIPTGFSDSLFLGLAQNRPVPPEVEFTGDMTDFNYMISAIWSSEYVRLYIESVSGFPSPYILKETSISKTSGFTDFDMYMPGLLVLSVIMLMFTASIAFVTEIENGTILRFRLSGLSSFEFITGVTVIQLVIGVISVLLTLGTALMLGFNYNGSLWLSMGIVILTALSIIAFSVILAALSKTANEILVIGNFPLFLFMFFTGAVFPLEGKTLFSFAGYGINVQGIMSPTHAIIAIKKIMFMNAGLADVIPELASILILTIFYFAIGIWIFNRKHMKLGWK